MKKDNALFPKSSKRRQTIRGSRRPLLFTLILMASVVTLAVGSAWLPGKISAARQDQTDDGNSQAISASALQQIQALQDEKEARTPAQRKIDSQLLYATKMQRAQPIASGVNSLQVNVAASEQGRVVVDISASVDDNLLQLLANNGAVVLVSTPEYNSVRVEVGLDRLEDIAASDSVYFIQPKQEYMLNSVSGPSTPVVDDLRKSSGFKSRAQRVRAQLAKALANMASDDTPLDPGSLTSVGSQQSEGDVTHRANTARGTFSVDGTGVKIGVMSNGVTSLAIAQAAGDLGPVTVLPGQQGSGDEGTAMLEIVHDLAPGAQLFYATALSTPGTFANNIRNLRAAGCDIIVDDVFYFIESPFQDGQVPAIVSNTNGSAILQAVNDVTAAGALYFSSAGNQGNKDAGTSSCFQGDFVDGGPNALLPGGTVNNFGGGVLFDQVTQASGNQANLYWADPLGGSTNDYDLFVLNATSTAVVSSSTNVQSGTQDPFEAVAAPALNNRIVVFKKTAAAARFFHITINANGAGRLAISTEGTTKGHSMNALAYGVSATPAVGPFPAVFSSTNVTETFTSDGPRRIFFNADGTAITAGNFTSTGGLLRQKPDITAADGVTVTGAGGFASPFFGTSAAAPHAAAIAALIKQAKPAFTPAQIRTALTSSAIDIQTAGVDRNTGAGIIMAYQALQAAGATGTANLQVGTTTASEVGGNGNGAVDAGETGALSVQLTNPDGANAATAVSAVLSSTTPGVAVTQPNSAYADIAINGAVTNTTPFGFVVSSGSGCPATLNFNLTVTYSGGASPKVFAIAVSNTVTINETLDNTTAPASGGLFVAATGLQNGRLVRNALISGCGLAKASPGVNGADAAVPHRFDSYRFSNPSTSPICVTVTLTTSAGNAMALQSVAYAPIFDPTAVDGNYLGDLDGNGPASRTYAFTVGPGSNFVVVVNEITGGSVAGTPVPYTLRVAGVPAPCLTAAVVNQPPVNTVPGAQSVIQNSQLVFSTANGNAVSIADPDAGGAPVKVTLTATNGTLSLSSNAGLSFSVGTGFNDSTMTFTGTIAAINAALQGLTYRPNFGFTGAASLTITTNDQGFLGSGGEKSDTDVVAITVTNGSAFKFDSGTYLVGESDGQLVFTVLREGDNSTAASIQFATSNDTASDRSDYGAAYGTLNFAPGQFSATFPVLINEDSLVEGTELFNLTLSNPQGTNVALGLQPTALGVIVDNNTEPATNVIDGSNAFVRQHYHDFLNREADPAGLAFWVNNIESCGANAACREVKRIDTSASFFLSIEFQQTGFLAYRTYAAAFGPTRVGSTVPLTAQEFLTDTQQLGSGVIIGNAGAEAQLEANKVAYFNQFVTRPEFVAKYPAATNEQYVDNLLATAGLSPSQVRLFAVNLTNGQEVPPTNPTLSGGGARPASFGTARFRFNDAQTALTMTATINNIDVGNAQTPDTNDNLLNAHIHAGPTVAPGINGPVVWGFFGAPFNDNNPNDAVATPTVGGVGGTFTGKWDALEGNATTLAAQLANLREGRAYINFHTVQFGGGEIRGNFPAADAFRNSLVTGLNGGTETRATVLRKVAEAEELGLKEFNRAFVLMQYFGYLRRNPNDTPDTNFSGYTFWLNKLNAFNGDFRAAELVKAFITSSEYRKRFGLN